MIPLCEISVPLKTNGHPVKTKRFSLILFGFIASLSVSFSRTIDSIAIFRNLTREETELDFEQRFSYIQQAIDYSKRHKDTYNELYFHEKKVGGLLSVAQYELADELDESILKIENSLEHVFGPERKKWERLHVAALSDRCIVSIMANDYAGYSELIGKIKKFYDDPYATGKINMCRGIMAAHKHALDEAIRYFRKSREAFLDSKDMEGVFKATANIGLALLSQQKYQEALSWFLQCHQLAVEQNYKGEKLIIAYHYMGQGYSGVGNYELANRFYKEAIELSRAQKNKRILSFSQYNYAQNLYKEGNYRQAEKEAGTALKYFEQGNLSSMQAETFNLLADIHKAQGDYKVAFFYQNRYINLIKEFWQDEQAKNLKKFESSLEDYKLQQKVQEAELAKAKILYRNLLIGVLIFLSLVSFVGLIVLYRRFFRQKRISQNAIEKIKELDRLSQARTVAIENHLNTEIGSRNKELLANTLLFLRISNIASTLQEKMQDLKKSVSLQPKDKVLLYEAEQLIEELDLNKNWGEFELYFEQTTGDFFSRLSMRFPSLTPYEKRICALYSLDLNNKDIAILMGRSFQSISMAKTRIKRKLNANSDDEFVERIKNL